MANLRIEITSDLLEIEELRRKLDNPRPLYKAWANHLEARTIKAFKSETAPDGSPWQALKPETLKRKAANSVRKRGSDGKFLKGQKRSKYPNKILRDLGTLYDSVAATVVADGAEVGTSLKVGNWSLGAIHQFGAPRRNIPARPFLPMDAQGEVLPQDIRELEALARDWLGI